MSDRKHICSNCGYEADRDYNASLNILHIAYHRQTDDRSQGLTSLLMEENPLLSMISAKEVLLVRYSVETGSPVLQGGVVHLFHIKTGKTTIITINHAIMDG